MNLKNGSKCLFYWGWWKGALRTISSMTPSPRWPGLLIGNLISMKGSLQVRGMWCWFSREKEWVVIEMKPKWPGESWNLQANFVLLHFLPNQTIFHSMLNRGWLSWLQQYWLCRHNLKSIAGMSDLWKMWLDLFKNQKWTFIFSNEKVHRSGTMWGQDLSWWKGESGYLHYKSEGNRAEALESYKSS